MVVIVRKTYTPRDFLAQRYNVTIKRSLKGTLKKVITSRRDDYGFTLDAAVGEAEDWARLLGCEIQVVK